MTEYVLFLHLQPGYSCFPPFLRYPVGPFPGSVMLWHLTLTQWWRKKHDGSNRDQGHIDLCWSLGDAGSYKKASMFGLQNNFLNMRRVVMVMSVLMVFMIPGLAPHMLSMFRFYFTDG